MKNHKYQSFFNYMAENHNLNLLNHEIELIAEGSKIGKKNLQKTIRDLLGY